MSAYETKEGMESGQEMMVFILILIPITIYLAFDVMAEETDTLSVSGR